MPAAETPLRFGIVLLAAGGSTRLGQPKQLLPWKGGTLLSHSLAVAGDTGAQPVILVLGAGAETIQQAVDTDEVTVVYNREWKEGMAASIRCGMAALNSHAPGAEGVILMVCDQPQLTAPVLHQLIEVYASTGKTIIASGYGDTFGPPVFFHHSH